MRKREEDLDLGLLGRVHELYRTALADTPRARQWLGRHGVDDARLLDRFALGFAPGTLKAILPRDRDIRRALRASRPVVPFYFLAGWSFRERGGLPGMVHAQD